LFFHHEIRMRLRKGGDSRISLSFVTLVRQTVPQFGQKNNNFEMKKGYSLLMSLQYIFLKYLFNKMLQNCYRRVASGIIKRSGSDLYRHRNRFSYLFLLINDRVFFLSIKLRVLISYVIYVSSKTIADQD
jgi:hypothetical protein